MWAALVNCLFLSLVSALPHPAERRATPAAGTLLGCFSDNNTNRTLGAVGTYAYSGTGCVSYCATAGYAYAGIEYGVQCYCDKKLDLSRKIADTYCNKQCSQDATQMCGGVWAMNVYKVNPVATSTTPTTTTKAATTTAVSTTPKVSVTTASKASTTVVTSSKTTPSLSSTSTVSTSTIAACPNSRCTATPAVSHTCVGQCGATIGIAPPPSATGTKAVYAHHIVGNTYTYSQADWANDISLAKTAAIDGFALNLGSDSWETTSVAYAYAAAKADGAFKLFFSLDMTSLSCSSAADALTLSALIAKYASNTAQAQYKGRTLVSTFAGDSCLFGQGSALNGWNLVRSNLLKSNVTIFFVPSIWSDPATFNTPAMAWLDGELNWNSGWPTGMDASDVSTASDQTYMAGLGTKAYMPAISPAFFTYYGPNSYNKDWIYRSDDWLLAQRFEQVVQMRNKVDFTEIISWNDFGESHYIGPLAPAQDQPNSTGWTNGMPHTAWLTLIKLYATAFKTGVYPAPATDGVWLWTRPHAADATATNPTNAKPTRWQYTDDNLYAVAVLTSAATVKVYSGTNSATLALPAGVSKISIANMPGAIGATVVRNGATVKSIDSTGQFAWVATPIDYNYNYFVMST